MMTPSAEVHGQIEDKFRTAENVYQVSTAGLSRGLSATRAKFRPILVASHPSGSPKPTSTAFRRSARKKRSSNLDSSQSAKTATGGQRGTAVGPSKVSGSKTTPLTSQRTGISSSITANGPSNSRKSSNHSSGSSLSVNATKAVIAATVIGGTLILALIIFLLWRRRKGRRDLNATRLRPPSTNTFLSVGTRDANLTALPIRRERRSNMAQVGDEPSDILPRGHNLPKYESSHQDLWKTANPPTPTTLHHPIDEDAHFDISELRPPEMLQLSRNNPIIRLSSHDETYPDQDPAQSIHVPSEIDLEMETPARTPSSERHSHHGWSLTTSYNKAKSRLDSRSLASTVSSVPGIRNMREWMHSHSEAQRGLNRMHEGEPGPSRTSSMSFLKNKATKPNLAPLRTSELSQRQSQRETSLLSTKRQQSVVDYEQIEDVDAVLPEDGVIC